MPDDPVKTAEAELDKYDLVETDEQGKPVPTAETKQAAGAEPPAKDVEDEDDDERVALSDEDKEERKRERQLRKERQKEHNRRRELELQELRQSNAEFSKRLQQLEGRGHRFDAALLDDRLNTAKGQLDQANQIFSQAILGKDPTKVAQAMEIRDRARDQWTRLNDFKGQMERASAANVREERETETRPRVDPRVQDHIDAFRRKHDWFDMSGGDRESRLVLMLDQEVKDAGFSENTQAYWDELEKRGAELLPHRFKAGKENGNGSDSKRRSPPVAGSGADTAPAGGKTRIFISPERKKAMQDNGSWDDPVKRARVLKSYAKYDKEHAADSRR